MNLKKFILFTLTAIVSFSSFAQDKIYMAGGSVVEAKIIAVTPDNVTYKKWDAQSGPEITVLRSEVLKIVYENGTEDKMDNGGLISGLPVPQGFRPRTMQEMRPRPGLKKNIFSVSPFEFTESGVGLAVGYEKVLDKEGVISYSLPVVLTFNPSDANKPSDKSDPMVYFMPGLKFYPTSYFGTVKYAIGPSLDLGYGQKTQYDYSLPAPYYSTNDHLVLGMMLNNYLNINPTDNFYIGIDFGLGFTYVNNVGGASKGIEALVQGGFKMGVRY